MVKNPPAKAGATQDAGLIPGMGRSPGGGNGNLVQNSCLEGSMDRGAWWAAVHRITESDMERVWSAREFTHTFTTASQMGQDGICYQEVGLLLSPVPKDAEADLELGNE